jgi:hypothetical protein
MRQALFRIGGMDLTGIDGIGALSLRHSETALGACCRQIARRTGETWQQYSLRPGSSLKEPPCCREKPRYSLGWRKDRSTVSAGSVDTGPSRHSQRIISGRIAPPNFWPCRFMPHV